MKELWVEKYRPKQVSEYVFRDLLHKQRIENWISEGGIPHLLFSGGAGTGKTTLALLLVKEFKVAEYDFLQINASRDNGVDIMRERLTNFGQTMPFGEYKVVLLDEADYLTPNGQAILRGIMEQYHEILRFILTCNYPNRIIPAIHSRCQGLNIQTLDETEFTVRVGRILDDESIKFEMDVLELYVRAHYPDLRKTINTVQLNSTNNVLQKPKSDEIADGDYKLEMVSLFKQGKLKTARNLICKQIRTDEYEDIYKFLYRNLDFWSSNPDTQDEAIIIIRNGLVKHGQIADPEINLSATLIELEQLPRF